MEKLALLLFITVIGSARAQMPQGPITQDFQDWLNQNGYQDQDFVRMDLGSSGSYGGKTSPQDNITNQPVIFIHGNSDAALNHGFMASGWSNSISYFLSQKYTSAELYATTWGDANAMEAEFRTHDCATLSRMRKFIEAVIAYTNQSYVDVVSHSMGVTIGRRIIKGGTIVVGGQTCNLGDSLTDKVDTFVGLAGGNYGLCNCAGIEALFTPTCNKDDGFWPGDSCGTNAICGISFPCTVEAYSTYLKDLNSDTTSEGKYVFAAWSTADDLIMYQDNVWGNPTSMIPNCTGKKIYSSYTHMQTKEQTAADQFNMVVNHSV